MAPSKPSVTNVTLVSPSSCRTVPGAMRDDEQGGAEGRTVTPWDLTAIEHAAPHHVGASPLEPLLDDVRFGVYIP
jgi:hypothetical protein